MTQIHPLSEAFKQAVTDLTQDGEAHLDAVSKLLTFLYEQSLQTVPAYKSNYWLEGAILDSAIGMMCSKLSTLDRITGDKLLNDMKIRVEAEVESWIERQKKSGTMPALSHD